MKSSQLLCIATLFLLTFFLLMPSLVLAAEIRIIGPDGMFLASKKISTDFGRVQIAFRKAESNKKIGGGRKLTLQHIAGISNTLTSTIDDSLKAVFVQVPGGVWELKGVPDELYMSEVRVFDVKQ